MLYKNKITRQDFVKLSGRLMFGAASMVGFNGLAGCSTFGNGENAMDDETSKEPGIVTSRIKMGTIGATDLNKTEDWYGSWLDYSVVERGDISDALARSWGTPNMEGRPYILMQPASGADVFIRAAQIDSVPDYRAMTTWGWNSFEIIVDDVYALNEKIKSGPFSIIGSPKSLGDNNPTIHAMQVIGPSQEVLYLTTETGDRETSSLPIPSSFVDRLFIVILAGPDALAIQDFYSSNLGMTAVGGGDYMISVVSRAQGLPEDYTFQLKLVRAAERGNLIEIDKYPVATGPRPRHEGQLPPGNAMVSFSVNKLGLPDVDWFSAPLGDSSTAYGDHRSGAFLGPVGEITELVEERRES